MPRMTLAAKLEQTKQELRRIEKRLGNERWALLGAGARANPPSPAKKRVLKTRVAADQAMLRELRAERDELAQRIAKRSHGR